MVTSPHDVDSNHNLLFICTQTVITCYSNLGLPFKTGYSTTIVHCPFVQKGSTKIVTVMLFFSLTIFFCMLKRLISTYPPSALCAQHNTAHYRHQDIYIWLTLPSVKSPFPLHLCVLDMCRSSARITGPCSLGRNCSRTLWEKQPMRGSGSSSYVLQVPNQPPSVSINNQRSVDPLCYIQHS
jgi:hypothetical protein